MNAKCNLHINCGANFKHKVWYASVRAIGGNGICGIKEEVNCNIHILLLSKYYSAGVLLSWYWIVFPYIIYNYTVYTLMACNNMSGLSYRCSIIK